MKREKGLHFKKALLLLDDGTTRPYKIYIRRFIMFGHWVEDYENSKKSDDEEEMKTREN